MRLKLALILIIAFLLRFYSISTIPSGFTPDEASFGYDAYSILKTGKDQWGHPFPMVLESFGDYKSPVYAYLSIPFVWILGLTKLAVRLPNALLGTLAVLATYLLTLEIFKKIESERLNVQFPAITAAFLLAISPWHIMMSRGAFEANLTTFFLPLSLYFFIRGLKNSKYFIFASIIAGINIFTYHSAKLITPLIFIFAIVIFRKEIFKNINIYYYISGFVILLFSVLFLVSMRSGSATRIYNVSIFKSSLMEAFSDRSKAINSGMDPVSARVIFNKYQAGFRHFMVNYISYFSPQYYFSQGPAEATYGMIPGRGVIYWFEFPLILSFVVFLIKNKPSKYLSVILFWFFVSPVPAAMSQGPGFAANRAVIQIPSLQILMAAGFVYLYSFVSKLKIGRLLKIGYLGFASIIFAYFLIDYFLLSSQKVSSEMLYGRLEASLWLNDHADGRSVIVSKSLSEPHIYIAFADKFDPDIYQKSASDWKYKELGLGWVDQIGTYRLGNYTFSSIDIPKYKKEKDILLVGKPDEFPEYVNPKEVIKYPDGKPAIYVVETPIL